MLSLSISVYGVQKKTLQPAILDVTRTFLRISGTAAYGRKQTSRLSLNGCFLTAALEEKADIRYPSLRGAIGKTGVILAGTDKPNALKDGDGKSPILASSDTSWKILPKDPRLLGC